MESKNAKLIDGNAYMFDFKGSKGLIGILHSYRKYETLHRMFCVLHGNVNNPVHYNAEFADNIRQLVPEENK
jgi:hypothetical protein